MSALVVLGMHRSGTSCLAGMLGAAGLASAGEAVRNWDNVRGHHERLELVRLNEAVLAHSGGHWLSPPSKLRWTQAHAAERDRLLCERVLGRPPLLKDPRMLLALPFWRAASEPFHAIGVVRHPLAVARSLESWRNLPVEEGVALWTAHNRALLQDREAHGTPLLDFDAPRESVVCAAAEACASLGLPVDEAALAKGYDAALVHHDAGEPPMLPGLDEALALHRRLVGSTNDPARRPSFPRQALAVFKQTLERGELTLSLGAAREALAALADPTAVLVPVVTALVRRRAFAEALTLIDSPATRLEAGLKDLLHGKVLLAMGEPQEAARHLEAACAVPDPLFQAKRLLPLALRESGRPREAREAQKQLVSAALYAHGPLATLAEWCWLDGDRQGALTEMARAIILAPPHRRGRLRTRRAEWLIAEGDPSQARAELLQALEEDPGYPRSKVVLATLG
jgi:tetratricopeptide (TPR) repeat protein